MSILSFLILFLATALGGIYKWSVIKPTENTVEAILGNDSKIFGHRGGALDAPENTLAAFRLAKKHGAYGIELDLSFTKDNVAIVFHDDDLDRVTNGKGPLSDFTYAQLKELDASVNHMYHEGFKGERIPTFDEAIEECLKLGLKILMDIKEFDERVVPYLEKLFDKHPELYTNAVVASFFPQVVYKMRQSRPKVVGALIWRPNFVGYHDYEATKPRSPDNPLMQKLRELGDVILDWSIHRWLWHVTGANAVFINKDVISKEYLKQWKQRNIPVLAWTPNQVYEKELLQHLGVHIITDTLL